METIVIQGGVSLQGKVRAGGSKNASLPLMAAALLAEGTTRISNVPQLRDIKTMADLMRKQGAKIDFVDGTLTLDCDNITDFEAPYDLVRTMRASVLVLGPLVARWGRARVSMPGGCAIGERPIDQHLRGLEKLGATITLSHGYVEAAATRLKGGRVHFDVQTVGGTENILMAAALADGTTTIENAAREPEIVDLANLLIKMGADIEGAGSDVITVRGVRSLTGAAHAVIADRIEAGTFLVAAGITGGDVTVTDLDPAHQEPLLDKLRECGVEIDVGPGEVRARMSRRPKAIHLKTWPFPGFPTDMQAQMMALLSVAEGASLISETVFENRYMHVSELRRLGAEITVDGRSATVTGVPKLFGAPVMASDLRASAALILAGLAAEGKTVVNRIYHLDRGYERIERKLSALGANVQRVKEDTLF
jgi:UDP-N-acetylglucosamine 1-carboxyvinyltransferase